MIDEKALLKLMKAAYKGGGVRVARQAAAEDRLTVRAGHWAASLPMAAVPGKVLGLLAEWMHSLPLIGQSFLLISGEEPEPQPEDAVLDDMLCAVRAGRYSAGMKPAGVTLDVGEAFQLPGGGILLFDTGLIDLVRARKNMGGYDEASRTAYWQDEETGERVWACPAYPRDNAGLIGHLARYDFWAVPREECR